MTIKDSYMLELESLLKVIPEAKRKEWLYDYYLHFQQAVENGQSEADAARELGDPKQIANELLLSYRVVEAETNKSFGKLSRAVFATVGLGLFNIIFVIGPYIGIAATLFALWVSAASIALAGVAAIVESLWSGTLSIAQAFSVGLICISIAILLLLALKVLTKHFFAATLKYLQFNTRIIRGNTK